MKKILYFLLLTLAIQSCKKENKPQLPPITTTGANTMGCMINGAVFEANSAGFFDSPVGGELVDDTLVYANGYSEIATVRFWCINKKHSVGNAVSLINGNSFGEYFDKVSNVYFRTDDNNNGELTLLKIDTANYIVSGTFWFDAVNEVGEKVEIREGRFDIKY